jgi:hypothetical protein
MVKNVTRVSQKSRLCPHSCKYIQSPISYIKTIYSCRYTDWTYKCNQVPTEMYFKITVFQDVMLRNLLLPSSLKASLPICRALECVPVLKNCGKETYDTCIRTRLWEWVHQLHGSTSLHLADRPLLGRGCVDSSLWLQGEVSAPTYVSIWDLHQALLND